MGPGVSGHLLGGVLAAVMLGPWAGAVVIGAVLIVQCFLFGDGGLTALGANFVNMGLIGSVGGYAIYAPLRRLIGGRRGILIAAMVAAWFAVLLAAGACSLELSASGHPSRILPDSELDGPGSRGDRAGRSADHRTGGPVHPADPARADRARRRKQWRNLRLACARACWLPTVLAGLGIALAVAVFLSPFASTQPDGLEFVGERLGLLAGESPAPLVPAPMPDYQLPLPGLETLKAATAIAGLVGTLVVFGLSWRLGRVFAGAGPVSTPAERAGANAA